MSLYRKFRKKPVVIEAVQWFKHGDHPDVKKVELAEFNCSNCGKKSDDHGTIKTLEGVMYVCPGDWIILGIAGELYPCKPNIFEATYEPVE